MAEQNTQRSATVWMKSASALALTLAATLSALSPAAHAQSTDQGALPAAAQQGDVTFLSGGVGKDESDAIKKAAAHWPLSLSFIGGDRNFVADVAVKITDAKGATVLETSAKGPYMMVRLHPGHYTVHATDAGQEVTHAVNVTEKGHARASFSWKHA